jgi:hypothetical protein
VGRGTHVNEGMIVTEIYRLYGAFLLYTLTSLVTELKKQGDHDNSEPYAILQQMSDLFQRWSKTPMGEGSNDEMMEDLECVWDEACSLLLSLCDGEELQQHRKRDLDKKKADLWKSIDQERKTMSSLTNVLSSYENVIDVAMSSEGISFPRRSLLHQIPEQSHHNDALGRHAQSLRKNSEKWSLIIAGDNNRFLVGLGGNETSRAFAKYISFLQRTYLDVVKKGKVFDVQESSSVECYLATFKSSLIVSFYERAVSECPTVEHLWTSFINFLWGEWTHFRNQTKGQNQNDDSPLDQQQNQELLSTLQSASYRAIRNCPYSMSLFEIRMTTLGLISASNLDPDVIQAVVQEASDLGFLTSNREAMLYLRLVAIRVVKRRLLSLVSLVTTKNADACGKDYDDCEGIDANYTNMSHSISQSDIEEIHDLLEEVRDMYDEVDTYLFNSHPAWSEGKTAFWKNRALAEAYTLCPISKALVKLFRKNDGTMVEEDDMAANKKAVQCFEKLVKVQKPSHPDSWREYIRYVTQSQTLNVATAVSSLRKIRALYTRAMSSVRKMHNSTAASIEPKHSWMGKGIDAAMFDRDYNASLLDLCREYLDFERNFGSPDSLTYSQTQVHSKMMNWNPSVTPTTPFPHIDEYSNGKRKHESNVATTEENGTHDGDECEDEQLKSKRSKVQTNLKQPKKTDGIHKVRIGKLEYPAHPFTIHVYNLSKDTQDMDLVDTFSREVGAIVHAKILREKCTGKGGHHYHGESKCAGLIQFEERLSVENALQQDGLLEIGGKTVRIQRSHLPAIGTVPVGMHRVNPKGEGKVSKRNEIKKKHAGLAVTKGEPKVEVERMDIDQHNKGENKPGRAGGDHPKEISNSATASSPSSLKFGILSLKPRNIRPKPKISLNAQKPIG